jgi:hypothetical protein
MAVANIYKVFPVQSPWQRLILHWIIPNPKPVDKLLPESPALPADIT